jgi:hypothetical protein
MIAARFLLTAMPSNHPTPPPPARFDWWQALVRVLSSIEAVRDGRALYVMLAAFSGAGLALATAQASAGRGELNWAIGQGAAALFIAFFGANAAGLILMDRAQGRPSRDVWEAVEDALGIGHRVLLTLAVMLALLAAVAGGLLGLYALCELPRIGSWLFVLVVPTTVVIIGLSLLAMAAIVAPLTGPTVWAGASAWEAIRTLLRLMRERLLQATVLFAGLSLATGLVGLACTGFALVGGRVMAYVSVYMLGVDVQPEVLMAGLFGYGLGNINAAGIPPEAVPYIRSATVGGGVVFALALVMPTVVYLRGVCEIYLSLMAADDLRQAQVEQAAEEAATSVVVIGEDA